jgi:hypothetical protein
MRRNCWDLLTCIVTRRLFTYFGNLSKILDNLAITLNHLFLNIQADLASCLGCVADTPRIKRLQGIADFQVRI